MVMVGALELELELETVAAAAAVGLGGGPPVAGALPVTDFAGGSSAAARSVNITQAARAARKQVKIRISAGTVLEAATDRSKPTGSEASWPGRLPPQGNSRASRMRRPRELADDQFSALGHREHPAEAGAGCAGGTGARRRLASRASARAGSLSQIERPARWGGRLGVVLGGERKPMRVSKSEGRRKICTIYSDGGRIGLSISPGVGPAEALAALRELVAGFEQVEQQSPDVRRRTRSAVRASNRNKVDRRPRRA